MDVVTAILTRRSVHHLTDPAPDDGEFAELLAVAAAAPDHGQLQPWRWVLVRGPERLALGECFAADAVAGPRRHADAAGKTLRAPLLATLVFQPRRGHRVPEWEQLAAAASVSHGLMLLLHARGYGSIWRTGAFAESPAAHRLLGLDDGERLLGWLYVGTAPRERAQPIRGPRDVRDRITRLRLGGGDPDTTAALSNRGSGAIRTPRR